MARTQVYLDARELQVLDRARKATGASRSELIRRAIQATYGEGQQGDRLSALRRSAGSWKGRSFSGAAYVDAVRGDLGKRLRRLGLG